MMYKASFVGGFFMRKKAKKSGTSTVELIIKAVMAGIVCAIIMLLIYSLMLYKELLRIESVKAAVVIINFISVSICGLISIGRREEGRGIRMLLSCGILTLIIVIFSIFTGGNSTAVLRIISCGVGGIIFAFLLTLGKSNKKLRKRTKRRKFNN